LEAQIVGLKNNKPHWGARKIRELLLRRLSSEIKVPSRSTIHAVLDRSGVVKRMGRRRNRALGTALSAGANPNDLWCADFKGEFTLGNKRYCYPLTVTDHASRYLLMCEALESVREDTAIQAFEQLFRERGLPTAGHDCASISMPAGSVIITTDPVPPPGAKMLGGDDSLFWLGWLLVTINASDLAAGGGVPKAFVASLDLPRDMELEDLENLLSGIKSSCVANSIAYVGGNIREADTIRAAGTAIGHCEFPPLTREGAVKDDIVCLFGRPGNFWSDAMRVKAGMPVEKMKSNLFAPFVTGCLDSSVC
jgi:hypothetical protein